MDCCVLKTILYSSSNYYSDIAFAGSLSFSAAQAVITGYLKMHHIVVKFTPPLLILNQKGSHVIICENL